MKKNSKNKNLAGFTLIELLVVITIIGLLSSILVVTFRSAQQSADQARVAEDAHSIINQIEITRDLDNETVGQITGNWWSIGVFNASLPVNDQPYALAVNNQTWINLGFTNGAPLDPWGQPYMIDENEGEPGWAPECTRRDDIVSAGPTGLAYGGDNQAPPGIVYPTDVGGYFFNVPFFACPEISNPDPNGTEYYNGNAWPF